MPFFSTTLYDTWFKVGRQFVVTGLVEQDVISLANITALTAFCLHTLSAEVSPARLSREEAVANGPR